MEPKIDNNYGSIRRRPFAHTSVAIISHLLPHDPLKTLPTGQTTLE
uniref:Uncharacterized protein n=1 Tax=Anopheles quadriannulatus TaxID=34691 RepID=A0A182XRX2_ANOQN